MSVFQRYNFIQFQDKFIQMFPQLAAKHKDEEHPNVVKNFTFQVTEACSLACTYCLSGDTKIMMSDYTVKDISDIQVGDTILGFDEYPEYHKQTKVFGAKVLNTFHRKANVLKVTLETGESFYITPNHKVLTRRNSWMKNSCDYVAIGNLSEGRLLYRHPLFQEIIKYNSVSETDNYKKGYLVGVLKGDGSCKHYNRKSDGCDVFKTRLAVKDTEIIQRAKAYMDDLGFNTYLKKYEVSKKYNLKEDAIFSNTRDTFNKVQQLYAENFAINNSFDYLKGFLAGIYDAEGHISTNRTIRICNTDESIINEITRAMDLLRISYTVEKTGRTKNHDKKFNVRISDNKFSVESMKFIKLTNPAVTRKKHINFLNYAALNKSRIFSMEIIPEEIDVYNIETESGTYIANGIAVHNCYQIAKTTKRMSFETAKKIVDRLYDDDNGKSEAIVLEFIGGEPLLEVELIDKIIDYFMMQGILRNHRWATYFMVSICSNGVAYFEPKVQAFIEKHQKHLSFSISIDGYKELHDTCRIFPDGRGSYDIAVAGALSYMLNYNSNMGTKMTFAPENIRYVSEALKNLINLGYKQINANCIFEEGWTQEHSQIFYQELKKAADWMIENDKETVYLSLFEEYQFAPMDPKENSNFCGGDGKMLAVDPDGTFYPCIRYMPTSLGGSQPPITCGHMDTGIDWNKLECMQCITRRSQSTDECFNCPIASGCAWCTAYNYQRFGTIDKRATYICEMHKARALANVYFWNKVYRKHNMPDRFKMHCPKDWALKIIDEQEYEMLKQLSEA